MNEMMLIRRWPLGSWSRLRELLQAIADLQDLNAALTTPDGLRRAVELVLRLGELLGLDAAWLDRLRPILTDDGVLQIVLAVWQFVLGARHEVDADEAVRCRVNGVDAPVVVTQQSLADWLPIVVQLISLLRMVRGSR
jgi:hypothetical protein